MFRVDFRVEAKLPVLAFLFLLLAGMGACSDDDGGAGTPDGGGGENCFWDGGTGTGGRIYGRVVAADTDQGLAGVRVTARLGSCSESLDATTNDRGRFEFEVPVPGAWAVTARLEGYTFSQRRAEVPSGGLVAVETMYLTPIDPQPILLGPEGGSGTNSQGNIALEAPAGAFRELTEVHATWFVHGWHLPNALPAQSHFTYAFDLSPDGIELDEPLTVRLKNERGFAPGTPIPVGVYDPETLEWRHETMGRVTDDGQWVEFEVTHFSARDCNLGRTSPEGGASPGALSDLTGKKRSKRNNRPCSAVKGGSFLGVADGHLTVGHGLPGLRKLGMEQGLELVYDSALLNRSVLLWLSYDITQTRTLLPERIRFEVQVGGNRVTRFYEPFEGKMTFMYLWDGRDPMGNPLPEGTYDYELTLANEYQVTFAQVAEFGGEAEEDTGVPADELLSLASSLTGQVQLGGPRQWGLGFPGWGIQGLWRLERDEATGAVSLFSGGGSFFGYLRGQDRTYEPLPGDFGHLEESGDGFTWTWQSGERLAFDARGRQTSFTDFRGNRTTYEYDAEGRLVGIVAFDGSRTELSWDSGHLASATDAAGRTTRFEADDAGNLVRILNPDGSSVSFSYDDAHRLLERRDAAGGVTRYHYDSTSAIVEVEHPDGGRVSLHSLLSMARDDAQQGDPYYVDASGGRWTYRVDAFGTRTYVRGPLGREAFMNRDSSGRLVALKIPGETGAATFLSGFAYDDQGNLTGISGPGTTSVYAQDSMSLTYDEGNRLLSVSSGALGDYGLTYDGDSALPSSVSLPGGFTYETTRDERGLVTSASLGGYTATYAYDAAGNLTQVQDPSGGRWLYEYDVAGNLTAWEDPAGRRTTYAYNDWNRPLSYQAGGQSYSFEYGPAQGSDWDGGPAQVLTAVVDGAGGRWSFAYDEAFRLAALTDPLDRRTELTYDPAGRLISRSLPNGDTETFSYNEAGQLLGRALADGTEYTFRYGQRAPVLLEAGSPDLTERFEYDAAFRITGRTLAFSGGPTARIDYEYRTASGWMFQVEFRLPATSDDPAIFEIDYDRDHPQHVDCIMGPDYASLCYADDGRYLPAGWDPWSAQYQVRYERDGAGRITHKNLQDAWGGHLADYAFEYDPAGLLTAVTTPQGRQEFEHDAAGRLVRMTPPAPQTEERFSYDAAGNRRRVGHEAEYVYDAARQLLQDEHFTYEYDEQGNRTARVDRATGDRTTYAYNAAGQLVRVELPDGRVVTYGYDAFGRRVVKRLDGQVTAYYVWHLDDVLAELAGDGSLRKLYTVTYRPDAPVGVTLYDGGGNHTDYLYLTDPSGTVRALLDDDGNAVESYRYAAFGLPVGLPPSARNTRLFAGMDYDPDTGLYYARHRWYDPRAGLFLQPDPLPLGRALDPYGYAGSAPWSSRDPFGLTWRKEVGSAVKMTNDFVVKPAVENVTVEVVSKVPVVGGPASGALGTYFQTKDLVTIARSKHPKRAAADWYKSQWWNPAGKHVDSFISMGGAFHENKPKKRKPTSAHPGCAMRLSGFGWH